MSIKRYFLCLLLCWNSLVSLYCREGLVWRSPSSNSSGSMPCGGGDIGLNVWVENGDVLFYISRSGTFDENNTMLKQGRIRLSLSPNPFLKAADFRQTLNLNDGSVEICANGYKVRLWVDVFHPVVHCEVAGEKAVKTQVAYESWRYRDRLLRKGEGQQCSYKWAVPEGTVTAKDSIRAGHKSLLFFHRNKDYTVFDYTVRQQGLEHVKPQLWNPLYRLTSGGMLIGENLNYSGVKDGVYAGTDYRAWMYASASPGKRHRFCVVLHTARSETLKTWSDSLDRDASRIFSNGRFKAAVWRSDENRTAAWWKEFADRSYIHADGEAGSITRNYMLFRYMLGCNAMAEDTPSKFNGGLFTFDPCFVDAKQAFTPDYRKWGGGTMTAQNQRLVYWPMLKSGDTDLMKAQFNFYQRMLGNALLRTRTYWNHGGACFPEQIENFGFPNPAEYGTKRPVWFDRGIEYNAWLEYEWDTVLEFCQMILDARMYAGMDITSYKPLIESTLAFFIEHYKQLASLRGRKSLDGDGKLILYPGSACETYKMTNNASSTIAALTKVMQSYGVQEEMLRLIPSIPLRYIPVKDGQDSVLKQVIAPAKSWERINNVETPQLYPVFPWRIYGVGKPGLDIAKNTYLYDPDAVRFRSYLGWKQDNIWAACLGLTEDARQLILKKLSDGPYRFPAFWDPGYDWAPDHNRGGSGMIGLQEMLLQTDGNKLFLFPAWPKEWNVRFKLHAPYQTIVECELKDGKVIRLDITPESRRKDVLIMLK